MIVANRKQTRAARRYRNSETSRRTGGRSGFTMPPSLKMAVFYIDNTEFINLQKKRGKTVESKYNHHLCVDIVEAKRIPKKDKIGKTDPFCQIEILPSDGDTKRQTAVKQNTATPKWNEKFYFPVDASDIKTKTLAIRLADKDTVGSDLIGHVNVNLGMIATHTSDYKLDFSSKLHHAWYALKTGKYMGEILVRTDYEEKTKTLTVVVVEARSLLLDGDKDKKTDANVKVTLSVPGDDDFKAQSIKTETVKNNTSPAFNLKKEFELESKHVEKAMLLLEVWDNDVYPMPRKVVSCLEIKALDNTKNAWMDLKTPE